MLKFLYYLTLVSLTLGQLTNISKSNGTNIYLFDALVLGTAFLTFIYQVSVEKSFKLPKPFIFLLGFIFTGSISLVASSYKYNLVEAASSGFYIVRFLSYLLFALTTYNLVLSKKISKEEILYSIVYSGIAVVVLGFIQLVVLPDFEQLDPLLGWDPHKNRLASTFFDPNFVGAYLVICITILLDRFRKLRATDIVLFTVLFAGLIFTFSRSAWLMFAVAVFIYGIFRHRALLFVALLIMFLSYYSVPRIQTRISGTTDPADSAQFRWASWSNTVEIIKDAPVLGVGYNTLRYVQKDYGFTDEDTFLKHSASGSDSSLLFVAATTGIVGLILFLFGILLPLLQKKPNFLYLTIITSLIVESQFINSLLYPQILFVWLICLGLSYL